MFNTRHMQIENITGNAQTVWPNKTGHKGSVVWVWKCRLHGPI